MAATDYVQNSVGPFAALIELAMAVGRDDAIFSYTVFNFQRPDPIAPGMAAMIGDEIVRVETVAANSFTVKRGCADTVPAAHAAGDVCWIFDQSTGTDSKERGAGQTIGVKVSPFTTGGGAYPIAQVTPDTVIFNWRFFRPYPPAQMKVNNARWHVPAAVSEGQPNMSLTWVHRDRILQANQLLGQDDATIGPEPGATYTMRVYSTTDVLLRTEPGIRGTAFNYQWPQIVHDLGNPTGVTTGYLRFTSSRQHLDAWQDYRCDFTVDPAGTLTSQFLAFDQRVIESTYQSNLRVALSPEANSVIAVAARPADRMSDGVTLLANDTQVGAASAYTPWVTSDFRLPELETTFNVRSSSLYDGVAIELGMAGQLAMIDDEIVRIDAIGDNTITIRRGCCDTVPAVHIAGARMWLYEQASHFDATNRADGDTVTYKLSPVVYGPPVDPATLPSNAVTFNLRSERPYPPGRIVINGRPWFEEAQATSGAATAFSWARRNRITQGLDPAGHAIDDIAPEVAQLTRLQFYYTTPSATPGQPADVHILRTVSVDGTSYSYPYALAQADGNTAGIATGVCGTVVIFVQIDSVRSAVESLQKYVAPLRLPSYPCAG